MKAEGLKRFALFSELSDDERESVVELLEERRLLDAKSAFREGTESEGLVLLEAGRLKLRSARRTGVVGTLEAPAHLGAASLFVLGPREVTAIAEGQCTLQLLSRAAFARLLEDAPSAAARLAAATAADLAAIARESVAPLTGLDLD